MKVFWLLFEGAITSSLLLWLVKHPAPAGQLAGAVTGGTIGAVHTLEGQ